MHGEGEPLYRRIVDHTLELVAPGGIGEEPPDRTIDLPRRISRIPAGLGGDARSEFIAPDREILGEIIQHLRRLWWLAALQPSALRAASTASRISLRLPSDTSPTRCPAGLVTSML